MPRTLAGVEVVHSGAEAKKKTPRGRGSRGPRLNIAGDKILSTGTTMQANGHYFPGGGAGTTAKHLRRPLPRFSDYDGSYDGSQYDSSHDSMASGRGSGDHLPQWKPPESLSLNGGGSEFDAFDFHQPPMNERGFDFETTTTPREERASLTLNTTHLRPPQHSDVVGRHLLYETALLDTQTFDILDIAEVDALKKEQGRLNAKIEATQRKLALESKVRDAAQNLQRLYSTNKRPDTPQSPESPKKRNSLRPNGSGSIGQDTLRKADSELAASVKKVDELHEQIRELLKRREDVERRLLRHTAAVLAEEANRVAESAAPGMVNGHHYHDDDDDDDYVVGHAYSDFDGVRDILRGRAGGTSHTTQQQEEQLARVQTRLEELNYQLRNVISEAGQTLGRAPAAEVGLDQSEDSNARMDNRFARLEHNLYTLEQQHREMKAVEEQHLHVLQQQERDLKAVEEQFEDADRQLHGKIEAIEEHLEGVNGQLHSALLQLSDNQPVAGLGEPPRAGEHSYEDHLQYMEEGLLTMEQLLQQRSQAGDSPNAQAKLEELDKKHSEYEAMVSGLWDVIQTENPRSPQIDQEGEENPSTPLKEPFSLEAFNTRVRHILSRDKASRDQHEILRRQIQQQRDLGGKSDMEKEAQISEIQTRHDELYQEHQLVQEELSTLAVKHEEAKAETEHSRGELAKVVEEVEKMHAIVQTKQTERDDMARQKGEMRAKVEVLERQVQELTEQQEEIENKYEEMDALESEVVRLTTELTMSTLR